MNAAASEHEHDAGSRAYRDHNYHGPEKRQAVKPPFHYMPDNASAEDWHGQVIGQMDNVVESVRDGVDVRYATELLRESVDRYLVAVGAETRAAE